MGILISFWTYSLKMKIHFTPMKLLGNLISFEDKHLFLKSFPSLIRLMNAR